MSWPSHNTRLMGQNAMTMKVGEAHKFERRYLAPFFEQAAVMRCLPMVNEMIRVHFGRYWEGKSKLPALKMTTTYTFATACNLLMSLTEGPELDDLYHKFKIWSIGHFRVPVYFPGFAFHSALKMRGRILICLRELVAERKQELAKGSGPKVDLLTFFLTVPNENGNYMSDDTIEDNLLSLLFASYDTTSATLGMTLLFVAKNPQVLKQLQEEHMQIVQRKRKNGESTDLIRVDLMAMKYTWWVIQESIRLHPPLPGNVRVAIADFNFNGHSIRKGWKLAWTNLTSHYDPKYFVNPLVFDPSRWERLCTAFSCLPFGGGERKCPGAEMAKIQSLVFVHHLVSRYRWTLIDPDEIIVRDPMPRTSKDIPIGIERIRDR